MTKPDNIQIESVMGSTAYGLARAHSDIDLLGVFVAPTRNFFRLNSSVRESYHEVGPEEDFTYHEIGKFMSLALKCNPSVLELLYVDRDDYTKLWAWGAELVVIRFGFLSESYVRNAYGGYAEAQFRKFVQRQIDGKEGFSSDVKHRTAKHARHCVRLLRQGAQLLETGTMSIKVDNPQFYFDMDDMTPAQLVDVYNNEKAKFDDASNCLPQRPNFSMANGLLEDVRQAFW